MGGSAGFIAVSGGAALAALAAWWPPHGADPTNSGRTRLWQAGAFLALLPLVAMAAFRIAPSLAIATVPVPLYAPIEREFWLPFVVLFFAIASRLVRGQRERRAMRGLGVAALLFVVQQTIWRLGPVAAYGSAQTVAASDAVCRQTTDYTCGAAAMVTLLHAHGIDATEGEMAALSRTAPERGVSDFQAADGLRRKLEAAGSRLRSNLAACESGALDDVPTPFIATLKHSFFFDHMVCVFEARRDAVLVGDPAKGLVEWDRQRFERAWRGTAIHLQ